MGEGRKKRRRGGEREERERGRLEVDREEYNYGEGRRGWWHVKIRLI